MVDREGEERDLEVRAYELQASVCCVMAGSKRLHILHLLGDGERSGGELAAALKLRQANVSQHLTLMRERGIAATRQKGEAGSGEFTFLLQRPW